MAESGPPVRGKLPSLIDDEPPPVSRIPGAGWRPSTVSQTMKGVAPHAAIEATETKQIEATETKRGLSAVSHFHLAEAAAQGEDLAVAEDHARKAVEQDPANVDAANLLDAIRAKRSK